MLDLGCGDGAFAAELLGAGCAVTMADVAGEALRRARARAPGAEAVALVEGAPLPFAEDAFDVVWAGEVLEHVADVVGLLAEVRRVLRWGGTLLVDHAVARAPGRRHRRALRSPRRPPALLQRAHPARGARRRGFASAHVRRRAAACTRAAS